LFFKQPDSYAAWRPGYIIYIYDNGQYFVDGYYTYFIIIFHLVARPRRRCRGPGAVYILRSYLLRTPSSRRLMYYIYDGAGTNVQYVRGGYIRVGRSDVYETTVAYTYIRSHIRSLRPITTADTRNGQRWWTGCRVWGTDRTRDTRNTYDIMRTIYYKYKYYYII